MCTVVKKESCLFIADEKIFKGKLTNKIIKYPLKNKKNSSTLHCILWKFSCNNISDCTLCLLRTIRNNVSQNSHNVWVSEIA